MKIICLDPGHGGSDNGAIYGFAKEKDINLDIARLLKCILKIEGFEVFMTRESDVYISLENRCDIANTIGSDLFLSIHCDAFHKETATGISTHIFTDPSVQTESIATNIHDSLMKRFPDHKNRGLKYSNFYVLKHTRMSSALIECEFLSNPKTRKFLNDRENQFALANAISGGIRID